MPSSRNIGGGLNAISDAIKFYMNLRADKMDRERVAASDKLNRDKFQFDQTQHKDNVRLAEDDNKVQRLTAIRQALDSQPGRVLPQSPFTDEVQNSPYAGLLKEAPPQLASRSFGSAGPMQHDAQPGGFEVLPTEDSAYRRAILTGNNSMARTMAGINSREGIADANRIQRNQQFAKMMGLRWETLGQDQQQHLDRLAQQKEYQEALIQDRNIDNLRMFENPPQRSSSIFDQLMPGASQTPTAPRRTRPPMISLGSPWEEIIEEK